ncbi:MAG TPA: biotin--[acetyl-CoA-carboxylase] ligase [Acidimicrobiales bacterium]|nr:biotin--[acetyl-CoA-carboxylase] ligase [Acidimicrobiales bacterium]
MYVDGASRFDSVERVTTTTSTNSVLAERARAGAPEGLVLVADYQSQGRGRFDRSWEAPPGACLLMSVLLRPPLPELPPSRRHLAVGALSLAVREAAAGLSGADVRLKWPNDVMAGVMAGAKLAGVLAEAVGGDAIVVGAGVNVSWRPPDLPATSLEELAGHPVDREEVLARVLQALDRLYGDWESVARLYEDHCATIGRHVRAETGEGVVEGVASGVDADGALLVVQDGRPTRVVAGDVVHVR